jgi:hypothetical protein
VPRVVEEACQAALVIPDLARAILVLLVVF